MQPATLCSVAACSDMAQGHAHAARLGCLQLRRCHAMHGGDLSGSGKVACQDTSVQELSLALETASPNRHGNAASRASPRAHITRNVSITQYSLRTRDPSVQPPSMSWQLQGCERQPFSQSSTALSTAAGGSATHIVRHALPQKSTAGQTAAGTYCLTIYTTFRDARWCAPEHEVVAVAH